MIDDLAAYEHFITTRPPKRSRRRKGKLIRFRCEPDACGRLAKRREKALPGVIRYVSYRMLSKAIRGPVHPAYLGK